MGDPSRAALAKEDRAWVHHLLQGRVTEAATALLSDEQSISSVVAWTSIVVALQHEGAICLIASLLRFAGECISIQFQHYLLKLAIQSNDLDVFALILGRTRYIHTLSSPESTSGGSSGKEMPDNSLGLSGEGSQAVFDSVFGPSTPLQDREQLERLIPPIDRQWVIEEMSKETIVRLAVEENKWKIAVHYSYAAGINGWHQHLSDRWREHEWLPPGVSVVFLNILGDHLAHSLLRKRLCEEQKVMLREFFDGTGCRILHEEYRVSVREVQWRRENSLKERGMDRLLKEMAQVSDESLLKDLVDIVVDALLQPDTIRFKKMSILVMEALIADNWTWLRMVFEHLYKDTMSQEEQEEIMSTPQGPGQHLWKKFTPSYGAVSGTILLREGPEWSGDGLFNLAVERYPTLTAQVDGVDHVNVRSLLGSACRCWTSRATVEKIHNANLDILGEASDQLLRDAIQLGNLPVVQFLLDQGISLSDGGTSELAKLKALVYGAPSTDPLEVMCAYTPRSHKHTEQVLECARYFLPSECEQDSVPGAKRTPGLSMSSARMRSLLHQACQYQNAPMVQLLLSRPHANDAVHHQNPKGETPLLSSLSNDNSVDDEEGYRLRTIFKEILAMDAACFRRVDKRGLTGYHHLLSHARPFPAVMEALDTMNLEDATRQSECKSTPLHCLVRHWGSNRFQYRSDQRVKEGLQVFQRVLDMGEWPHSIIESLALLLTQGACRKVKMQALVVLIETYPECISGSAILSRLGQRHLSYEVAAALLRLDLVSLDDLRGAKLDGSAMKKILVEQQAPKSAQTCLGKRRAEAVQLSPQPPKEHKPSAEL